MTYRKLIFISLIILVLSLSCIACGNSSGNELSIDEACALLGESRSNVHQKLHITEDQFKYPFSENFDPYKQYEELTIPKILEGQQCILRLRFSPYEGNDILRDLQCIFICTENSGYNPPELYDWAARLYSHLDERWRDQAWASPSGDEFGPVEKSEFSAEFSKSGIWYVGDGQKTYMLSYDYSPVFQGQAIPAVSVMLQLINL